jgi:hypothetical protein
MKKLIFLSIAFLFISGAMLAQVSVNNDGSDPDQSAMLDVKSTSKGTLLTRMTQAQIIAIQNPSDGLIAYCTTDGKLYIYVALKSQWKEIPYGAGILGQPFPCGISITINHLAGLVAPVTKTVTYGTVTNIPGEPSKCWITSNLGADHQATAVNDATEASGGWYWQATLKQGYKHDGTTRTPNTTWITSFPSDTTDWIAVNDPCAIELGYGWRIPTYTEWYNVDNIGGWTNWNGPWNSGLKLHAAGYLNYTNGSLLGRCCGGHYWSSTHYFDFGIYDLIFESGYSFVQADSKGWAFTIRCIRNL